MMKRSLYLIFACTMVAITAQAQISYGVKAGINSSKYRSKEKTSASYTGFHAGIVADIPLFRNFSLQPELFYLHKGSKGTTDLPVGPSGEMVPVQGEMRVNYLELTVNFLYKYNVGPGKLFGGAGPNLGYGLNGKSKIYIPAMNVRIESPVKFENNDNVLTGTYIKPFEAGVNFIAGYELNAGLLLSVNYNLGLTDTSPGSMVNSKSAYFGISAGYLLKRKKSRS